MINIFLISFSALSAANTTTWVDLSYMNICVNLITEILQS